MAGKEVNFDRNLVGWMGDIFQAILESRCFPKEQRKTKSKKETGFQVLAGALSDISIFSWFLDSFAMVLCFGELNLFFRGFVQLEDLVKNLFCLFFKIC